MLTLDTILLNEGRRDIGEMLYKFYGTLTKPGLSGILLNQATPTELTDPRTTLTENAGTGFALLLQIASNKTKLLSILRL